MSKTNQKGFTLVELVIVLAIGALVIAGVLVAVNGAQKNRRDSTRKSNISQMVSNVQSYISNSGGIAAPTSFPANSIGGLKDPKSGAVYTSAAAAALGTIQYTAGTTATGCDGAALTASQFKITTLLESGDTACADGK